MQSLLTFSPKSKPFSLRRTPGLARTLLSCIATAAPSPSRFPLNLVHVRAFLVRLAVRHPVADCVFDLRRYNRYWADLPSPFRTGALYDPRQEGDGLVVPISSLRDRAARYQESASHFERLAATEPVEAIRDQWQALARDGPAWHSLSFANGLLSKPVGRSPSGVLIRDRAGH